MVTRLTVLLMAGIVVVAVLLLAGVSSAGQEAAGAKQTLTIWHYYDESSAGQLAFIKRWEKNFEAANPDIDVQFIYVPYSDFVTKLTTAAAAGKGPDIVMGTGVWIPDLVNAGALQPLDAYWSSYSDRKQYPAAIENASRFKGKMWAVQAYANTVALFYNQTILAKLKLKPPRTIAQLDAALRTVKANAARLNIKYPLTLSTAPDAGGEFFITPWIQSSGWTYQHAANMRGLSVLDRIGSWVKNGYICKCDSGGYYSAGNFLTGRYAFAQDGNWNLSDFAKKAKFKYGVVPMPGPTPHSATGGETFSIGRFTSDPDLAWRFVREEMMSKTSNLATLPCKCTLPLRADVAKLPAITRDPYLRVFAQVAQDSLAPPALNSSGKITSIMGKTLTSLIAGAISGADARKTIATQVPPLVAKG